MDKNNYLTITEDEYSRWLSAMLPSPKIIELHDFARKLGEGSLHIKLVVASMMAGKSGLAAAGAFGIVGVLNEKEEFYALLAMLIGLHRLREASMISSAVGPQMKTAMDELIRLINTLKTTF